MVIFDTIRYNADNNCKNTNIHNCSHIYKHSQCSHPFIYEHNRGMLRLVSFTNTVAMFTKELDRTNLFVKLKKQCTNKFLIRV